MLRQHSPRPIQFRLLTLFIVMTIVAAICGVVEWAVADHQRLMRERDEAEERATRYQRNVQLWKETAEIKDAELHALKSTRAAPQP
jgi:hypothetical protein